jgi:putative glycosyltransferase
MKLSIVTTLYKSEATVAEFVRRASAAALAISEDYEIVMVDDGSPDGALAIAVALASTNPHLKVVELSRNFGHHKALMTGLEHAAGAYCFLIDSDLEEDPAILFEFFDKLQSSNADVVYGFQSERKGKWAERITGDIAYLMMKWFIPYPIPRNHVTVRLMRREYADSLLRHREQQTVIGGLWVITGYRQVGLLVNKSLRGETTYSLWRRWLMLIDGITSFSETPLIAIFYLGITISSLSVVVASGLIVHKIIFRGAVEGWVSVMLSGWFVGGLLILCGGVLGL